MRLKLYIAVVGILFLTGCTSQRHYKQVSFRDLPGWEKDDIQEAFKAQKRSCQKLNQSEWAPFCQAVLMSEEPADYRHLMETHLIPYQVVTDRSDKALLTGYYEPLLRGSLHRGGAFQTPLYRLPGPGVQYRLSRRLIRQGLLTRKNLELVWVDDPIAAFFLEIQGSGRIQLSNGQMLQVGYAGCNGYPYFAIGKALIERGEIKASDMSLQALKQWLYAHPREAEDLMNLNQSYVFFKIRRGEGPIGAQGVPLTPKRSLAVDPLHIPLGSPVWIDAQHPLQKGSRSRQLTVAQDTGGAIKGPTRADVFWGFGEEAEALAGPMKSEGQIYVFLPKGVHAT